MMRILLDTNVVLDVLLNREPWVAEASAIWQANDDGRLDWVPYGLSIDRHLLRRAPARWPRSCPYRGPNLPRRL